MCIYEFRILFVQDLQIVCVRISKIMSVSCIGVGFSGNMTDNIKQNYVLVLSRSGSSRDYLGTADISDVRVAHNHMTWPQWQPGIVFIVCSFHIIIYLNITTKPAEWSCSFHCAKITVKTIQVCLYYQRLATSEEITSEFIWEKC